MLVIYTSKRPSFHVDGWETILGYTKVQCMQPNQLRCQPETVHQSGITIDGCVRLKDSYNEEKKSKKVKTNHAPYRMANCLTNSPSNKYNICYA